MTALDEVVADLLAERYAKPSWWKTPPTTVPTAAEFDDSETTCARRRRELVRDTEHVRAVG